MTADVHNDTYPAIDSAKADFTGKAVYISGASRGIGVGIATSFARAGASKIAISARSSSSSTVEAMREAAKAAGRPEPEILSLTVDLQREESVKEAAQEIKSKFGRLDVVVNNAGAFSGQGKAIGDMEFDEWKTNFNVNVHGPWLILKYFRPLLLDTDNGLKTIVMVASVGGVITVPGLSGYQTSKNALLRVVEFAAADYSAEGLLTFCVHPGNIDTGLADIKEEWKPSKSLNKKPLHQYCWLTRFYHTVFVEKPALCGDTLVYLTGERREWLAGRYVNVTWDMPQLMAKGAELAKADKLKMKLSV